MPYKPIPLTRGRTRRYLGGLWYICRDVGCPDLVAAALSRYLTSIDYGGAWWDWLAQAVAAVPANKPLPPEIPIGYMPSGRRGTYHVEVEET